MRGLISHWDIDGIASAVLVASYYNITLDYVKLSSTNKIYDYVKELKKKKVDTIIITDLNPSQKIAEKIANELKKKTTNLYWIDHHIWNEKAKEIITSMPNSHVYIDEKAECASMLVPRVLFGTDKVNQYYLDLIELAKDDDTFSNKYELTKKWRILLRYGDWNLRYRALESWIEGLIWPEWAQIEYEKALREYRELLQNALNTVEWEVTENGTIAFVKSDEKLHPGELQQYIEKERKQKADLYVFIYKNGISLRSNKIDVAKLALSLGGGGHTYAAGVNLDDAIDRESLKKRIIHLLRKIF